VSRPRPIALAPGYAPRRYLSRPSYSLRRPFTPFLPLFYAALDIPWSFWYRRPHYVFVDRGFMSANGLPVLAEEILPGTPVHAINHRLNVLRATYAVYISQGYDIVPRFDQGSGGGYFAWVRY